MLQGQLRKLNRSWSRNRLKKEGWCGKGREGEGEKPNFKRKQALRQVEESLGT
jgi:hypothetical protein